MHSSQPPAFPRPSSSVARSRLQNRLVYSATNPKRTKVKHEVVHEEEQQHSVGPAQESAKSVQEKLDPTTGPILSDDIVISALSLETEPSMVADNSLHMSLFLRNSTSVIPGADSLLTSESLPNQIEDIPIPANYHTTAINFSSASLTEAIEYIIRGDIEYLYLQAAPDNPYLLSLCPHTRDINKSNFIMLSRHGITRYREQDSDFVTFREYFQEYTAYHKIIAMRTFGTLRKWKPFLIWKKYVNSHKRKRTIERLNANVFILDPFYGSVMRTSYNILRTLVDRETSRLTHHLLYDINTTPESTSTAPACSKQDLLQNIIDHIAAAGEQRGVHVLSSMPAMEHSHRYMQNEYSSCGTSLMSHRRGISLQQPSEYSSIDGDQHLSFTQRASIRLHCRRTANMIRLFDFLYRDSLYEAVEASLHNFHNFLQTVHTNRSTTRQLATLSMVLQDNSTTMELQPTRSELHTRLTQLLNETLSSGCHLNSLLLHQQFANLLQPIINEIAEFTLVDRVFQDNKNSLHTLVNRCLELILADVNACQGKIAEYSFLVENHVRNTKYIQRISCEYLHSLKPVEISQHLAEVKEELELYRSLPQYELCGVLRLEIRGVVRIAYTQLQSYKSILYDKLPELFLSLGEAIYSDTHRVATTLGRDVQDVDNFVKLVELYNIAASKSAKLEESYVYVLALKEVMEEHEIPSTDEIFGLNATIRSEFVKCTEAMSYFERNKEENTKIYKKELLSRVKLLQAPMEQITLRMSADLLLNPESNTDSVLEEIQHLFEQLQGIVVQSNYVENCQRALDMNAFDVVQANYTMKMLASLHALWLTIVSINDLLSKIYVQSFVDVDIDEISAVVKQATLALQKAEKRENSRLEEWIQRFIDDMTHLVPLLRCLTATTILDRHKGQINAVVGMKLFQAEYTPPLQEIVERGLVKHFDAIQNIHYQSECESNLELLLLSLQSMCVTKECVLQADSGNKGSMRIANLDECIDMLEDVQIRVQSALLSKHIDCMRSEYNELLSNVREWIKLCNRIRDLQTANAEYKILFTSSRTARYIHTALRYFNITDDVWRMIIKTLKSDCRLSALFERQKLEQMLEKATEAMAKVNETVDKFVEEQCASYPKFYLLTRPVLYDILETTDITLMLTKTKGLLLPAVSSFVMDSNDSQQIRGVVSNSETLEFHSEISSRSNLGTWLKAVEAAMTERLQADVHELITDARQIVEDARNGYCCCQSRLVAYQVKFWTALQVSLHPDKMTSRSKLLRLLQLEVNDHITMLSTILTNAKTRQHIQSLANLLLVVFYCRDVLHKICEEIDFAHHSFHVVDAAIRKYYNTGTNHITVEHYFMKGTYGMQYLGLMQQIAITPLTEKVYVSIASAMQSGIVPHLIGTKGSGKSYLLKQLMAEYGHELHTIDCEYASNEHLQKAVVASVSAGLRMAFMNAETLSTPQLSHLVSLITAAQQAGLLYSSSTTIGSIMISPHNTGASAGCIALCMNVKHLSDLSPMPASLRQKFRPIMMHLPSYQTILSLSLAAHGYTDPQRTALRLLAFLKHIHAHCEIDMSLMMKLLLSRCMTSVAEDINKQNMRDVCVQLYATAKCLFQLLPRSLHQHIDMSNLQTACGLYMSVAMNIDIDRIDFKSQDHDPVSSITNALTASSHVLVVGDVGVGKSSAILAAIRSFNRKERRSEDWPSKLFPQTINPTLLSYTTYDTDALYELYREFTKLNKYSYLHIDVPISMFNYYYTRTLQYDRHFPGKICWECSDIRDCDPRVLTSLPVVYIDSPQYNIDTVLDAAITSLRTRHGINSEAVAKDLKKCVSLFIRPMLQVIDASPYKTKDSLVSSAFHLIKAMLSTVSKSAEQYDSVALQRIVFYACLWTFGTCSATAQYGIVAWISDYVERCNSVERSIFPPSAAHVFDYLLQPVEESIEMKWVLWRESVVFARQVNSLTQSTKHSGYFSDYSLHTPKLLLPSRISTAAAYIQQCLSSTGGSLCITGDLGSGKSSVLQILVTDNAKDRWCAVLMDTGASRIVEHLQHAHDVQRTTILERGIRDRASIFIDDLNISPISHNPGDTAGAELYHSLLCQNGYYLPRTTHWKSYDQLYMLLSGSPRTGVNKRLMRLCSVIHMSCSDEYLTHVLTAKFASICPFVKEALSTDIVSISLRLFESLKMDDLCADVVAALIPRVSAATAVSHMLESVQVYVNNHAVVSSSDIVQAWKKVVASIAASSDYEKIVFNRLDTLALGVTFATPNFRAMMTKGSVIKRDKMRLPTMLRRSSEAPLAVESAQDVKVKSIGLMDMLELRRVVLSHAEQNWESVLDASNPKLWRDIQKMALFFITPSKYAVLPDCLTSHCHVIVKLACDLCSATYYTMPVDVRDAISVLVQDFLAQLTKIIYKSTPKTTEPKQWARIYRTIIRDAQQTNESIAFRTRVWHMHAPSDMDWTELHMIFTMNHPMIYDLLADAFGSHLYTNATIHKMLSDFVLSQKIVVSLNSDNEQVSRLFECPFITPHLRCIYLTKTYGLNVDFLGLFFNENDVESLSTRLRDLIVAITMRDDIIQNVKKMISTEEYTQGTYDMITHLLQLAERSSDWFKYRSAALRGEPSTEDGWALASDIIYGVLFARYVSCVAADRQSAMDIWLLQQLESASLAPKLKCAEVAIICYCVTNRASKFIPLFTMSQVCTGEANVTLSSLLLQLAHSNRVEIHGDAACILHFILHDQAVYFDSLDGVVICRNSNDNTATCASDGIVHAGGVCELLMVYLMQHGYSSDEHLLQSWSSVTQYMEQLCVNCTAPTDMEMYRDDVSSFLKEHFSKLHYICDTLANYVSITARILPELAVPCFSILDSALTQYADMSLIKLFQFAMKSVYLYTKGFLSAEQMQWAEVMLAFRCAVTNIGVYSHDALLRELGEMLSQHSMHGVDVQSDPPSLLPATALLLTNATAIFTRYGLSTCDLCSYVLERIDTFFAWISDIADIQWYPKTEQNWLEQVIITAVLKPVSLQAMIYYAIDNYGKWSITKICGTSQSHIVPSSTQSDRAVLLLRNDFTVDATIVAMDLMKKGFFESMLLRIWPGVLDAIPSYIFPQQSARRESVMTSTASATLTHGYTLTRLDSGPTPRAVDILNFSSISRSNTTQEPVPVQYADTGLLHVIARSEAVNLMCAVTNLLDDTVIESKDAIVPWQLWQESTANTISDSVIIADNFPSHLAHALRVLSHFLEMQDAECDMQESRLLILTTIYHAAVMCRLPPHHGIGDDTLLHALGYINLLSRTKQSNERSLLYLALYLYAAPACSDNFKCIVMALYEQYFTKDSMNFMEDYRIEPLDVLVPDMLSIDTIDACIRDIRSEIRHNSCSASGMSTSEWAQKEFHRFVSVLPQVARGGSVSRLSRTQRMKTVTERFVGLLPIPLEYLEKEAARVAKLAAKSTTSQIRQLSMQRNPGNVNVRRVQRQSSGVFSRSYTEEDPMWRFCLLECQSFNNNLEALKAYVLSEELLDSDLRCLECGEVPVRWLRSNIEENMRGYVYIDEYIAALKEKRQMLSHWLNSSSPGVLKLHLLHNPNGLLHALKEASARSLNAHLEEIDWECSFIDMKRVSLNELAALSVKSSESIVVGGLQLYNSVWNFESNTLEAPTSMHSSDFCQISAVVGKEYAEDDFLCPLYVTRDLQLLSPILGQERYDHALPLLHVTLSSAETDECALRNVSLQAKSTWAHVKRE